MSHSEITIEIDPKIAPILFGEYDQNLKDIAAALEVMLSARGNTLFLAGEEQKVDEALAVLEQLRSQAEKGTILGPHEIRYTVDVLRRNKPKHNGEIDFSATPIQVTNRGKRITPRTFGQKAYVEAIRDHVLTFGIGPAGTGKTYLAVAMAVAALQSKQVNRLVLTRPAVEAGEKLGFLPGDLQEKVDPYLRPLTDALFDILGAELYQRYMERRVIEIAPLAYMRGRTLDDSFIILDEAQNTTTEQMKMFLTRMGWGSKVVVTGDITQIDLPKGQASGLVEAAEVLKDVEGIAFVYLGERDVVRHEMVQKIIKAYDRQREETESPGS
ncbi:MAG TPA: PhoH family protein [Firmicutes bacterium]|uniref:PhoH-like protein n=1 Tax=Capillibacterium thermochitinicola TaxID=2699427 RepID=A0A8J6I0J8_9FIRM|nr:PhoH family protein [Capillibacterium thermochitinicola]MBA2133048.1 PhoH family protein [Capillibacterium thermochitinicola]HHW12014.1 PhoH family protein [Bacillota bacterium]